MRVQLGDGHPQPEGVDQPTELPLVPGVGQDDRVRGAVATGFPQKTSLRGTISMITQPRQPSRAPRMTPRPGRPFELPMK